MSAGTRSQLTRLLLSDPLLLSLSHPTTPPWGAPQSGQSLLSPGSRTSSVSSIPAAILKKTVIKVDDGFESDDSQQASDSETPASTQNLKEANEIPKVDYMTDFSPKKSTNGRVKYKLYRDGQKKAGQVAILPTCNHHFHSSCLEEHFHHQKQLRCTSHPKFDVVNCPRCLHPYPLNSSSSSTAYWTNFRKKCATFFRKLFYLNLYPKAYKPQKHRPLEIDKLL
ncbi:uncharacterized protein PGTG_12480 [Puccinia graminis f. sp. tritici CRL 75-36-700-3]|uniref:RING-type domain-containing protein n=1 Tax=Puccinia graminis f. sp. tritici (strain CRL 75-36-700-3 / race SCCL) TaxID=418459 RepID=E3KQE9_PUCGT|nr:uncharacterized protein PGTG_12480 [Puccinia graminis f. sp. tritici CRL 75-36-700-3]EFP86524.1 hypothetical protein PGTG_12480 [Puccinia graminis f. sp. tritici CRL 75-36-700-3]